MTIENPPDRPSDDDQYPEIREDLQKAFAAHEAGPEAVALLRASYESGPRYPCSEVKEALKDAIAASEQAAQCEAEAESAKERERVALIESVEMLKGQFAALEAKHEAEAVENESPAPTSAAAPQLATAPIRGKWIVKNNKTLRGAGQLAVFQTAEEEFPDGVGVGITKDYVYRTILEAMRYKGRKKGASISTIKRPFIETIEYIPCK